MKNLFLFITCLLVFNGFGQVPGKDSLKLSGLTVDSHYENYMTGKTSHYNHTVHNFFVFGNGKETQVKNNASNVYDIVKIFPDAAQKLMQCKNLRKKHTVLSATSIGGAVLFLVSGVIGGINIKKDPTKSIVFGSIALAGVATFYTLKIPIKKIDKKFEESLEEGVLLYNQHLTTK